MITVDELRTLHVFAAVPDAALAYLAGAVEDIRLVPGEYFAHEGDDRSLFIVVEGRAEITKVVGGDERVIGTRRPGQFFGEVPMTLSTPFPASGRAGEPTRVLKLAPAVYYSLAALAPSVPDRVAALARRYLDSLQTMAAEQHENDVRLIHPRRSARAHRVIGFLTRNQIDFDRVPLDADVALDDAQYPVLEFSDGARLENPTMRQIAEAVHLDVVPADDHYDVVILGAGPAGLTAAVNAAAEGLRTLVIETFAPGGQAGTSTRIENYTGFPFGISGDDLASRAFKQAKRLGAEVVVTRTVEGLDPATRELTLDGGDVVRADVVVLATGVVWRTLPVDGVDRFLGSGVYYGAARSDSAVAQGAEVCIVGAGNSAGQAALFFSRHARSVTMLVRGESLDASMSRYLIDQIAAIPAIRVDTRSEVVALHGGDGLRAADIVDRRTGAVERRDVDVLFVMIGADAETGWLPPEIARDARGFILTGADAEASGVWPDGRRPFALETSVPGVFAIGDVRSGSVKRVVAGVGEGGAAIAFTHQFLALDRPEPRE
ncbi:FAD-dependent oxidoreductase [Microbacterium sp. NPDC058389]|uniref:FAD-dependent oxidoreductase n=1 Tax=Microbacterium sp. NPDC058389 TaxID=3346475 RepID=UPI0036587048